MLEPWKARIVVITRQGSLVNNVSNSQSEVIPHAHHTLPVDQDPVSSIHQLYRSIKIPLIFVVDIARIFFAFTLESNMSL